MNMQHMIDALANGDAALIEGFFRKPGGRKYVENLTLILINTLSNSYKEKEALYLNFVQLLDGLEQRNHQKQGQEILEAVFANS